VRSRRGPATLERSGLQASVCFEPGELPGFTLPCPLEQEYRAIARMRQSSGFEARIERLETRRADGHLTRQSRRIFDRWSFSRNCMRRSLLIGGKPSTDPHIRGKTPSRRSALMKETIRGVFRGSETRLYQQRQSRFMLSDRGPDSLASFPACNIR
jgi:hypothetical protein